MSGGRTGDRNPRRHEPRRGRLPGELRAFVPRSRYRRQTGEPRRPAGARAPASAAFFHPVGGRLRKGLARAFTLAGNEFHTEKSSVSYGICPQVIGRAGGTDRWVATPTWNISACTSQLGRSPKRLWSQLIESGHAADSRVGRGGKMRREVVVARRRRISLRRSACVWRTLEQDSERSDLGVQHAGHLRSSL